VEGAGHFRHCPGNGLETLRKIKKIPFHNKQSPGRDLYLRLQDLPFYKEEEAKN